MRVDLGTQFAQSLELLIRFSAAAAPGELWDEEFEEEVREGESPLRTIRLEWAGYVHRGHAYSLDGMLRYVAPEGWLLSLEYNGRPVDELPKDSSRRPPRDMLANLGTFSRLIDRLAAVATDLDVHCHLESDLPSDAFSAVVSLPMINLPPTVGAPFDKINGVHFTKEDYGRADGYDVILDQFRGRVHVSVRFTSRAALGPRFPAAALREGLRIRDKFVTRKTNDGDTTD